MRYILFALTIAIITFSACNNGYEADVAAADSVTLASGISSINSPLRKIIHTASVRARVNDVYAAANKLKDMVNELDGRVTESNMENDISNSKTIQCSSDSQKIVREYIATMHLTLRVPAIYLDTVMRRAHELSAFSDASSMKQADVTLNYLANAMKNEAAGVVPPQARAKAKQPISLMAGVDTAKADRVVDRRIENLQLLDDVNYATLQVDLYQPSLTDVQVIADPSYITYVPFTTRVSIALYNGWAGIKPVLIALVTIWPLWLLAIGVYYLRSLLKRKTMRRAIN